MHDHACIDVCHMSRSLYMGVYVIVCVSLDAVVRCVRAAGRLAEGTTPTVSWVCTITYGNKSCLKRVGFTASSHKIHNRKQRPLRDDGMLS